MDFLSHSGRQRISVVIACFVLPACLVGCGPARGELRGTVYFDGKPLASGAIQFLGVDGIPHAGAIQADGSFKVVLPRGDAKVIVTCMNEIQMQKLSRELAAGRGGRAALPEVAPEELSRIPMRYADWQAAGLSVQVTGRKNYQDFYLTSN